MWQKLNDIKKEYTENREEKLILKLVFFVDDIIISHLDAKLERFIKGVPKKPKRLSGFLS